MDLKPDLVLDWYFDIPNQKLFCPIGDDLEYIAHEGGTKGVTKIYKGVTTFLTSEQWQDEEKFWISEQYGERLGYYQPRLIPLIHPETGKPTSSSTGIGPDGRGLDHLQRVQAVMEGFDCARVYTTAEYILFVTPDCGKTIFKREPTSDVDPWAKKLKQEHDPESSHAIWPQHPQPCLMHPRSYGVKLSSHEEMRTLGTPDDIVGKCERGEWEAPPNPELQKFYIYPTT
jgi:hypothetical protein